MKKNFLKVFSLLLVISMLAISVNAVVTDKPQSEITIAAPEQVPLYGDSATVTVTLTMPTCYAIEGQWTATDGLSMATLVADNGATLSPDGIVVWADVAGEDQNNWFKNPMGKMTATYTVSAAGSYTVTFTCTVFAGGKQITAGEVEVWEGTFEYSKTIQVVKHECSDVTTDTDHICDDENCPNEEAVTEHKHNTYGSDETQHWSICDCGQQVGEKVNHDFTNGDCICGAEKPVTNVAVTAKGTINHTVEGQVVTVTHSVACRVGYWDETEGKYIAIAAVANGDGSYSFTAPEGVTEVLLVVKGDITGEGNLTATDTARLNASILKKATLTSEQIFAGDVTGEGSLTATDTARLNATILKKSTLAW